MINCALIGYGYWGQIIKKYILENKNFNLMEIYDPKLTERRSLDDILSDSRIQCVFICTPINTHNDIASIALQNGKHVFCEKPLCKQSDLITKLSEIALQHGLCLYTDYIYTQSKAIQLVKEMVCSIGEISYVKASIRQFGNFYLEDNVYDVLGVHMISAILFIFDNLEKAKLTITRNIKIKSNDCGILLEGIILFQSNLNFSGQIDCSLLSIDKERKLEIIGERGRILFDLSDEFVVKKINMFPETNTYIKQIDSFIFDESNNLNFVLQDFYNTIVKKDLYNLDLSLRVTKILEELINLPIETP